MRVIRHVHWSIAAVVVFVAGPACGQQLTGTLKKIKDTGTITLGHRKSSVPFSYYDDNQKVVGYAIDLCHQIVDAVKKELKLDKLEVRLNPVTSATRIPLMANGTIDLECGSTTNNLERLKQVSFTITHFVTSNRFVSKKAANLKTVDDLKGKTVVSTSGTTNIKQITEINAAKAAGHEYPDCEGSRRGLPDGGDRAGRGVRDGRHPALQSRRRLEDARRLRDFGRRALGRALRHHAAARGPGVQESGRWRDDRCLQERRDQCDL